MNCASISRSGRDAVACDRASHPLVNDARSSWRCHGARSKILIADDNQANCELIEAYLAEVDCEIEVAVDGQDTLSKIASFQPDLILLDVMMPKLSGFEVCKKIKEDPERRRS